MLTSTNINLDVIRPILNMLIYADISIKSTITLLPLKYNYVWWNLIRKMAQCVCTSAIFCDKTELSLTLARHRMRNDLWSPAGKGLTFWLLLVMFIVFLLLSHWVSWVRCGTWLYRFFLSLTQWNPKYNKRYYWLPEYLFITTLSNIVMPESDLINKNHACQR